MIMEYCNLGSLSDNLYNYNKTDKANPILERDNNWQLRKNIIKDMISGLYFLHSNKPKKIIHRDIKSANVLLQEDTQGIHAKLGDFGLAKVRNCDSVISSTVIGKGIIGTMRWSAPELVVVDDDSDSDSEEEQQDKKQVKANERQMFIVLAW